jgi:hypothetical protein
MIALESNSGRKYNRDEVSNRRILRGSLYSKVLGILEHYSINKYKYFQVYQEHISWNIPHEHRQKIWMRKTNELILLNISFKKKSFLSQISKCKSMFETNSTLFSLEKIWQFVRALSKSNDVLLNIHTELRFFTSSEEKRFLKVHIILLRDK